MYIYMQNNGKKKLSPSKWFNKLRQQLLDMRSLFRRDSAALSPNSLQRRQELLEKVWNAFLIAYIDVVLTTANFTSDSAKELVLDRSHAARVYIDAKYVLEVAYQATAGTSAPVQLPMCLQIEDHLLHVLKLPRLTQYHNAQVRELINKVEYHARMVERIHAAPCPMMLCVIVELMLDDETYAMWKSVQDQSQAPSIWPLLHFLESRWAETYREENVDIKPQLLQKMLQAKTQEFPSDATYLKERRRRRTSNPLCPVCPSDDHRMGTCREFRRYTTKQRVRFLDHHRLCHNCFKDHHGRLGQRCRSRARCFACGEEHHVLVCPDRRDRRNQYPRNHGDEYVPQPLFHDHMIYGFNVVPNDPWANFDPEYNYFH